MKYTLITSTAIALLGSAAFAGGLERAGGAVGFMFDEGTVATLTLGKVMPKVSGHLDAAPSVTSGNMARDYTLPSLSFKTDLNSQISVGLLIDQPVGASVAYPTGTGYPIAGSNATVDSQGLTAIVKYRFNDNMSVYAGLRSESIEGAVPALVTSAGLYTLSTDKSTEMGYLVGAAYERKEIALRVALTYSGAIDHTLATTENGSPTGTMAITTPKSWNLEFQSGVAANTLVFGNIKWREWSVFDISPAAYGFASGGSSLVDLTNDVTTVNLGVGRKLNDKLSMAVSLGYEKANGGIAGNLSPTDGQRSITVSGSYDLTDQIQLRGGISYIDIGDAKTELNPITTTTFADNRATGVGLSVKYKF